MLKKDLKLYCFSPPVMIITFLIEITLLVYVLVRYKMSPLTRLVALVLACLGIFQLSEFQVCTDSSYSEVFSRLGYIAITLLPALGVHLVSQLAGKQKENVRLIKTAYLFAISLSAVFAFSSLAFNGHECSGNYAIFSLSEPIVWIHGAYYYLFLLVGIFMATQYISHAKLNKNQKTALSLQVVGYLSFLLPTAIIGTISPHTVSGIPSIMCGFAVIYALILVIGIVPLILKPKN